MENNLFEKQKQLAEQYAISQGYDTVRDAGFVDGLQYFQLHYKNNKSKLGIPRIIKISATMKIEEENDYYECWSALKRALNKLQNS